MSGAYKYRPQYTQNTIGPSSTGGMTKKHKKCLKVIKSVKQQGRGREVIVPKPEPPDALNKIAPYLEGVPDAHRRAVQIVNALASPVATAQQQDVRDRLYEWLHFKMAAAQNQPYEEGETCPECVEAVNTELLPLLAPVAPAELKPLDIVDDREDYEWNGEFPQDAIDRGVRRDKSLAPVVTGETAQLQEKVIEFQNHLEDVLDGANFEKVSTKLWNELTSLCALAAQPAGTPEQLDLTPFEKWWKDHFGSPHLDSTQQFNLEVMRSATEDAFILGLDNAADYAAPSQIGTPEQVREARLRGALYEHTEHCDYCIQNEPKWCSRGRELEAALATPPPREREPETSPKEDTK